MRRCCWPRCARDAGRAAAAAAAAPWEQRLRCAAGNRHFDLQGRIAASNGSEGFSAGLRWRQHGDEASIDLSAPLGFGAAHIAADRCVLRVTTAQGVDARQRCGRASSCGHAGIRAAAGEPALLGARRQRSGRPAQETIDAAAAPDASGAGRLAVDCGDYTLVGQHWLPRRLTVTREALRLKIVIHTGGCTGFCGE